MAQESNKNVKKKEKETENGDQQQQQQPAAPVSELENLPTKSCENIVKPPAELNENRVAWAKKFYAQKISFVAFSKEFIALKTASNCPTAAMDKHYDKCRYSDIPCNDTTRVVLQNRSSENDFIHANWMTMPDGFKYISTQGPIDETIDDFWHMAVTENVSNILMVCDFSEGLLSKCAQYIPLEKNEKKKFGEYTVKRVGKITSPMEDVKFQVFEVFHKDTPDQKYTINHYQYTNWPDHTAPKTSTSVLKLYRLFRGDSTPSGRPIIVHCSAGIGRTATFIGVDYCTQRITQTPDVLMLDLVREMRKMRDKAVQSHHQFLFMIVCITDLLTSEGVPKSENMTNFLELYKSKLDKIRNKVQKKKSAAKKK